MEVDILDGTFIFDSADFFAFPMSLCETRPIIFKVPLFQFKSGHFDPYVKKSRELVSLVRNTSTANHLPFQQLYI